MDAAKREMMSEPIYFRKHPTLQAVLSLAKRLDLRYSPDMQDWEYEVSDPSRLAEFVATYESGELDDDERFTLMSIIIDSAEQLVQESGQTFIKSAIFQRILALVETNIDLHTATICYWASIEAELEDAWCVTPHFRQIVARHEERFANLDDWGYSKDDHGN